MKRSARRPVAPSTALIFYGLGLGVLWGYLFPAEYPAVYESFLH